MADLTPVLCVVVDVEEQAQANRTEEVVARQLDAVSAMNGISSFAQAVVACEPVWPSARAARPGRSRLRRCTRTFAVESARKMLRWLRNLRILVRRQRQSLQCGGAVFDARCGRGFGGRRFLERR